MAKCIAGKAIRSLITEVMPASFISVLTIWLSTSLLLLADTKQAISDVKTSSVAKLHCQDAAS